MATQTGDFPVGVSVIAGLCVFGVLGFSSTVSAAATRPMAVFPSSPEGGAPRADVHVTKMSGDTRRSQSHFAPSELRALAPSRTATSAVLGVPPRPALPSPPSARLGIPAEAGGARSLRLPSLVIADAGVLPTSAVAFLDRLDEFFERNLFSFGIPRFRARIALTQAAERLAELQALERKGQLSALKVQDLLRAHTRLLTIARRVLSHQLMSGNISRDLVVLLTAVELSAADVIEELKDQLEVTLALQTPRNSWEAGSSDEDRPGDLEELLDFLENGGLGDSVLQGDTWLKSDAVVPPDILRFLAEQNIAKAERDLLGASAKIDERLAHGTFVVAEVELKAGAESVLLAARQLFAAGNYLQSLATVREAMGIADRLASRKIVLELSTVMSPQGEDSIKRVISELIEDGLLQAEQEERASLRARAMIERVREDRGRSFLKGSL